MTNRIIWALDAYKRGDIYTAREIAANIQQVPDYDWPTLLLFIGRLNDRDWEPTNPLFVELAKLLAKGPRRASFAGCRNIRMPVPD